MVKVIPFIYQDIDELFSNTYLVIDEDKNGVVIDPSVRNNKLAEYIKNNDITLKGVLLTHGHFDHIRGVDILTKTFNCPCYIFYLDEPMLKDPSLNLSNLMSDDLTVVNTNPQTLKEDDRLNLINEEIRVIWTPFHTVGSICFLLEKSKILFSGDTLFKDGIGRDDLIMNDRKSKRSSLDKLSKLDDEIKVYPGHGPFTSIGREKAHFMYY